MDCDEEPGTGGCLDTKLERLRYFTGRHMTARDFRDEQSYHRSFRYLHNRIFHGWGIACGLEVQLHHRADCRDRVVVRCGMAVDCCGREIIVSRDVVSDVIPWGSRPVTDEPDTTPAAAPAAAPAPGLGTPLRRKDDRSVASRVRPDRPPTIPPKPTTPVDDWVVVLCLEYLETLTEKVPVLFNQDACSSPTMESGRTHEGHRLAWRWVRAEDLGDYGWGVPADCAPDSATPPAKGASQEGGKPGEKPCPEPTSERTAEPCCFDSECPPHGCLPLAVIWATGLEEMSTPGAIDLSGRRWIGQARDRLTHICWISWTHGGLMSADQLKTDGRLTVRFDRPLKQVTQPVDYSGPQGINPCTFIVEYGGGFEDLDPVPYNPAPSLDADGRTAVYTLLDRPGPESNYRFLIGRTVYVTLKCDFLLDFEGNPVDGDHLGGRRPTGDGVRGGTFESWFTVVSDDDYERMTKEQTAGA